MTHNDALRDHINPKSRAVHEFSFSPELNLHTTVTTEASSFALLSVLLTNNACRLSVSDIFVILYITNLDPSKGA